MATQTIDLNVADVASWGEVGKRLGKIAEEQLDSFSRHNEILNTQSICDF